MPLRRSPLFCARNSRLRGGEDPGRGRRGPRSRGGEDPGRGRRLRLRGRGWPQYGDGWSRGLCGRSGRWGGWPRIAWNAVTAAVGRPEKPAGREERLRAGSREARGRHIVKRRRGQSGRRGGGSLPDGAGERAAPCLPRRENRPEGARRLFPMSAEWGQKGGFSASGLEIRPKRLPLPPQTVPSRCGRRD